MTQFMRLYRTASNASTRASPAALSGAHQYSRNPRQG